MPLASPRDDEKERVLLDSARVMLDTLKLPPSLRGNDGENLMLLFGLEWIATPAEGRLAMTE